LNIGVSPRSGSATTTVLCDNKKNTFPRRASSRPKDNKAARALLRREGRLRRRVYLPNP